MTSIRSDVAQADAVLLRQERAWRRAGALLAAIVAIVLGASYRIGLLDGQRLREGVPDLIGLIREMLPPDFADWRQWIVPVFDTLAMSISGTTIAVVISVALALLAARPTSPHPIVRQAATLILNLLRSVPELIMGILFVAAVGFGALPGALALGLHSVGMIGKFFAESFEHADNKPVEAIAATGASRLQVIAHGYLAQVWPQWADVIVYRWEYNFRASTVLGAVGAGGIGFQLIGALRIMEYRQVSAIILVILALVTVVDFLASRLRHICQ